MHEVATMLKLVLFLAKEEFHLIRDILNPLTVQFVQVNCLCKSDYLSS